MRSTRLFLRGTRALCTTLSHPGAQQRCLSSVGGPSAASNAHNSKDSSSTSASKAAGVGVAGAIASGICLAWLSGVGRENEDQPRDHHPSLLPQLKAADSENREAKVSVRERRYKDFSSISYKGEPYMTPRDFLESVTSDEPRRKCILTPLYENSGEILAVESWGCIKCNPISVEHVQEMPNLNSRVTKPSHSPWND